MSQYSLQRRAMEEPRMLARVALLLDSAAVERRHAASYLAAIRQGSTWTDDPDRAASAMERARCAIALARHERLDAADPALASDPMDDVNYVGHPIHY